MKKIIKLTESQLENLVKHVVNESKKEENFIQKAVEKQEKKGTTGKFGAWCKRNGLASADGEVTMKCINKAMKSDDSSVVKSCSCQMQSRSL
jgi:hypothetical protein